LFPTDRPNHPAHWFLYDANARRDQASAVHVPPSFLQAVADDLNAVNPLLSWYDGFAQFTPDAPFAYIELADPGPGEEIAAVYHVGDAPVPTGRELYIQRAADATPSRISILHPLYEPLQYPLLFPHGRKLNITIRDCCAKADWKPSGHNALHPPHQF